MKAKRYLLVLMAIFISLVLAACSGGDEAETAEGADPASESGGTETEGDSAEEVELRFAWWGSADRNEKYNAMLDMYEEENPHVTVIREAIGWGDYWTKLSTQAAGGNLPDIFGLHLLLYGSEYYSKDVIEPLDKYVESGLISTEGWDQSVLDAATSNGQLYALPKGVSLESLLVNTTKIEELGLEQPEFEMNYQEFADYLLAVQEKLPEGEYAMSDPTTVEHSIEMWARQRGGSFVKADGSALGFSKEDLTEYWTYWNDLREAGAIPSGQVSAEQEGVPAEASLFATGKTVFFESPNNRAKMHQAYLGDNKLTIIRYPIMADGEYPGGEQLQMASMAMSKNSEHKEEAAKLMSWFVNDLEATEIYSAENGIPGSKPVRDNLASSLHELDKEAIAHMEKVMEDIPTATARPEGSVAVMNAYMRYAEEVQFGTPIKDAVDRFFAEAETILKQN